MIFSISNSHIFKVKIKQKVHGTGELAPRDEYMVSMHQIQNLSQMLLSYQSITKMEPTQPPQRK